MGLDTVEIVVTLEDTFGIQLPDEECADAATVQDLADLVYRYITIHPNKKCLTQIVFYRIRKAFQKMGVPRENVQLDTKIIELLPSDNPREQWLELEAYLGYNLPALVAMDYNTHLDSHVRFLGFKIFKRTLPVTQGTIRQLIDWILSLNFETTINLEEITYKYEVERIVAGIINHQMGIPINEIEMHHSITTDLGID